MVEAASTHPVSPIPSAAGRAAAPSLEGLGWSNSFLSQLDLADLQPSRLGRLPVGRVSFESHGHYTLLTEVGEVAAELSGRERDRAAAFDDWPAVGDWLRLRPPEGDGPALVLGRLERRSSLSRVAPSGRRQVVGANLDLVFITSAVEGDLNLRRLERYLAVAREGGCEPVILLTKVDQARDAERARREVERVAEGAPVLLSSALRGDGLAQVEALLSPGATAAFVGSSGVGKSTLVNRLLGAELAPTGPVREEDGKGRHTTTARHLRRTPNGALLLDTPGMRELAIGDAQDGVSATFADVLALAEGCRYRDCRHAGEPGCAVAAALEAGELDPDRLRSLQKLEREAAYDAARDDPRRAAAMREAWKKRTMNASARAAYRKANGG